MFKCEECDSKLRALGAFCQIRVVEAQVALQSEKLVQQWGYAAAQRGNMAKHKMFVHKQGTENGNVNNVLISKLPHT